MDIRKVYMATRYNTGLKLRAIDALHFAREAIASGADYSERKALSITTADGHHFYLKPTEYKTADDWNPESEHYNRKVRYLEDCQSGSSLRFVGFADEISQYGGIDHKGWYCDNFYSEVYRGAVWQLPGRNGEALYMAGYVEPWNDGALINTGPGCHYAASGDNYSEAAEAAARDADHMAQIFAEAEREAQTEAQAQEDIAEAHETIAEARTDHSELIAELRKCTAQLDLFTKAEYSHTLRSLDSPRICAAVRSQLSALRDTVREARELIKTRTEEPWTANPEY